MTTPYLLKLSCPNQPGMPCTPFGSMILLNSVHADLSGLNAVIVGRSNIVGKPMCQLLLKENCTVTVTHSKAATCRRWWASPLSKRAG
jgi:methylenetetrahydrofolate dehydrogenase (NADP+) / methenyltetrahydrofolate cyclohydrolase